MMTNFAMSSQCFVPLVFHCPPRNYSPSPVLASCSWPRSFPRLQARAPCSRALRVVACIGRTGSENDQEPSSQEVTFDIKLPRRSLLVQFTCDSCGERTKRLINRTAYEKGTVFVQCAGCLVYHKFVDNLGLVVEYDLREELDADSGAAD